jgi:hypothetical protein
MLTLFSYNIAMEIHKNNTPSLYTQETIIFRSGLNNVNSLKPIWVCIDTNGNQAVTNGNHRAYKAFLNGSLSELPREIIGKIPRDISKDPNYKEISKLKVLDK